MRGSFDSMHYRYRMLPPTPLPPPCSALCCGSAGAGPCSTTTREAWPLPRCSPADTIGECPEGPRPEAMQRGASSATAVMTTTCPTRQFRVLHVFQEFAIPKAAIQLQYGRAQRPCWVTCPAASSRRASVIRRVLRRRRLFRPVAGAHSMIHATSGRLARLSFQFSVLVGRQCRKSG